MNSKSKEIGKVVIKYKNQVGLDVINEAKSLLEALKIDADLDVKNEQSYEIKIEILDIGSITEKDIGGLFNIFLKNRNDDENFIKVVDKQKVFYLPDDLDECIDWFIIEN